MAGGKSDTVIVNLGTQNQIKTGDLLSLQKDDNLIEDPASTWLFGIGADNMLTLSGEIYGRILIYKVFENHSFALVLSSDLPIRANERIITS